MKTEELRKLMSQALLDAMQEIRSCGLTDVATPTDILDAIEQGLAVALDRLDPKETIK